MQSEIRSTVLKSLVLCRCTTEEELELSTPNLNHLKIVESANMRETYWGSLASLVDACISFPRAYDYGEFAMILNSASNATCLDLTFEHISIDTTYLYNQMVYPHEK
jgi:hypothetical protein